MSLSSPKASTANAAERSGSNLETVLGLYPNHSVRKLGVRYAVDGNPRRFLGLVRNIGRADVFAEAIGGRHQQLRLNLISQLWRSGIAGNCKRRLSNILSPNWAADGARPNDNRSRPFHANQRVFFDHHFGGVLYRAVCPPYVLGQRMAGFLGEVRHVALPLPRRARRQRTGWIWARLA